MTREEVRARVMELTDEQRAILSLLLAVLTQNPERAEAVLAAAKEDPAAEGPDQEAAASAGR